MEEIQYYPYKQIGKLVNAEVRKVTHMLMCMMILEILYPKEEET